MSAWSPQVVSILSVKKHPGADALSIVHTSYDDCAVITKLDEYKVGDIAAFIPIDSIVPDTEQFHFLCPRRYEDFEENGVLAKRPIGPKFPVGSVPEQHRRIKAKKIRGEYSQGMLVPVPESKSFAVYVNGKLYEYEERNGHEVKFGTFDSVDEASSFFSAFGKEYTGDKIEYLHPALNVGDSVEKELGLFKWEEEEEDNFIPKGKKVHVEQESPPQGWSIPYYDIDSARKFSDCILLGEEIVMTEKIHGANFASSHDGEKLWVKSRKFYKRGKILVPIRDEEGNVIDKQLVDANDQWWDVARRNNLEEKLKNLPGFVFFGEVYGQVKGFRYDTEIVDGSLQERVRFFDIWNTKTMRYLDYDNFAGVCTSFGLDIAPVLYRGPWLGKEHIYPLAEGKTTLGGKHVREGGVIRTVIERYEPKMQGRMQVKLVGEGYNLQK